MLILALIVIIFFLVYAYYKEHMQNVNLLQQKAKLSNYYTLSEDDSKHNMSAIHYLWQLLIGELGVNEAAKRYMNIATPRLLEKLYMDAGIAPDQADYITLKKKYKMSDEEVDATYLKKQQEGFTGARGQFGK